MTDVLAELIVTFGLPGLGILCWLAVDHACRDRPESLAERVIRAEHTASWWRRHGVAGRTMLERPSAGIRNDA